MTGAIWLVPWANSHNMGCVGDISPESLILDGLVMGNLHVAYGCTLLRLLVPRNQPDDGQPNTKGACGGIVFS